MSKKFTSSSSSKNKYQQTALDQYFQVTNMNKCKRKIIDQEFNTANKRKSNDPSKILDNEKLDSSPCKENKPGKRRSRLSTKKTAIMEEKTQTDICKDIIVLSDSDCEEETKIIEPRPSIKIKDIKSLTVNGKDYFSEINTSAIETRTEVNVSINKPTPQSVEHQRFRPRILQPIAVCTKPSNLKSKEFLSSDLLNDDVANLLKPLDEKVHVLECAERSDELKQLIDSKPLPEWHPRTPTSSPRKKSNSPIKIHNAASKIRKSSPTKSPQKLQSPQKSPRKNLFGESNDDKDLNKEPSDDGLGGLIPIRIIRKIIFYIISQPHLYKLLTDEEENILFKYFSMPNTYQLFCFRLFTRQPKWYNIHKLSVLTKLGLDDCEVLYMYNKLAENNFIYSDCSVEKPSVLLGLLGLPEVKAICQSFKIKVKSNTKEKLIQEVLNHCSKQSTLTFFKSSDQILKQRIMDKMGKCLKLSDSMYRMFYKIHLLYSFATPDFLKPADLHLYMRQIMYGELILPKYQIDSVEIFENVDEFECFTSATEYYNEFLIAFEKKDNESMLQIGREVFKRLGELLKKDEITKPSYARKFHYGNKYASTLSSACKHLTVDYNVEVVEWLRLLLDQHQFCQGKRGYWYDHLAMILAKYFKDFEGAARVIAEGLCDKKLSLPCYHNLSRRGESLKSSKPKQLSAEIKQTISENIIIPPNEDPLPVLVIDANAQRNDRGGKRMYFEKNEEGEVAYFTVEQIAKNHYIRNEYTSGIHCEGAVIKNIFFYLFWDIIYEIYVPGTFICELQYLPLDFNSQDFYNNRQDAINKRLKEIASEWKLGELLSFIEFNWAINSHKRSLAHDIGLEIENYQEIIQCIGRNVLSKILERLVKNYRLYHSGMPDLFLWNFAMKKSKFVEVKGEKDKLSMKQIIWLDYLRSVGADIEVCHVHTIGSRAYERLRYSVNQTTLTKSQEQLSEEEFQ